MGRLVLITGGAGFIGSHLADELLSSGYRVRALDALCEQVHGEGRSRPDYLAPEVELVVGDVRDRAAVEGALKGVDAVFHFTAAVGVGQSMYEIENYVDVNCRGTAVLLEELIKKPVERLVVASSMSIYGEGLYYSSDGSVHADCARPLERLKKGKWEVADRRGVDLFPVATPETKPPSLSSVYALTKFDQERLCMMTGRAYGIPATALRFFNVFGTRQSFSNPYTGVLAIFATRIMNGRPPLIYEDGFQQRDFVSVRDVARACRLALEAKDAPDNVFNVGSGRQYTVIEIAERLSEAFGAEVKPDITGKYRVGDVRHCFADISLAKNVLGYEPSVSIEEGLAELAGWLRDKEPPDRLEEAARELSARGLTI